jgi:L-ascorbate metabolism protein UlaG (beta-lactamase superfamily)
MIKILGKNPSGSVKAAVDASPNYRDGAFQNLEETVMLVEKGSYWKMMQEFVKGVPGHRPDKPLPGVKSNPSEGMAGETVLTWFGHSSYHLNIEGKSVLIDPVFIGYAAPFSNMVKAFEGADKFGVNDFKTIDVLVLTHDHYDHLDYHTLLKLKPKVSKIVCSLGVASHLIFWGFNPDIITQLDWWQDTTLPDGMKITATPARHFSGRSLKRAQTLWSSFVLETPKHRIFLGGDSGYGTHFKAIGDHFGGFDFALLECGQYNQKWPMIHMAPEQTVQAHIDLNTKVSMPVHWGKFGLAYHPWTEPIERFTAAADTAIISYTTPLIGEQVVIGKHYPKSKWWKEV